MLISHTQQCVTLPHKRVGDLVNIETDITGRYVKNFMDAKKGSSSGSSLSDSLSENRSSLADSLDVNVTRREMLVWSGSAFLAALGAVAFAVFSPRNSRAGCVGC